MGMKLFSSGDTRLCTCNPVPPVAPCDPIPTRFTIKEVEEYGDYLLCVVNYPNCTTFNGNKILLLRGVKAWQVKKKIALDPHFLENNEVIARFRPDLPGIELAISVAEGLKNE